MPGNKFHRSISDQRKQCYNVTNASLVQYHHQRRESGPVSLSLHYEFSAASSNFTAIVQAI